MPKLGRLEVAQKYLNFVYGGIALVLMIVGAWYSFDSFIMTKADAEDQHKETAEELLHLQAEMARTFKFDNFDEREVVLFERISRLEQNLDLYFKIPDAERTERDRLVIERIKGQIDDDGAELEQLRKDREEYRVKSLAPEDDPEPE